MHQPDSLFTAAHAMAVPCGVKHVHPTRAELLVVSMHAMQGSAHVPCCPSFRFNPLAWRGLCFGRTSMECYVRRPQQLNHTHPCMAACFACHAELQGVRVEAAPMSWPQWFAVDRTRWARTVHALGLGREYSDPFVGAPSCLDHLRGKMAQYGPCSLGCTCTSRP